MKYTTLVTYWCHVRWLRFLPDKLAVDGGQVASLLSVHSRGSLCDIHGLLHFPLVPVGFLGQDFGGIYGHLVSCCPTMIFHTVILY